MSYICINKKKHMKRIILAAFTIVFLLTSCKNELNIVDQWEIEKAIKSAESYEKNHIKDSLYFDSLCIASDKKYDSTGKILDSIDKEFTKSYNKIIGNKYK